MKGGCPFCGSISVKVMSSTKRGREGKIEIDKWYCRCNDCFARGSLMSTKEGAIARWRGEPVEEEKVSEDQVSLLEVCDD